MPRRKPVARRLAAIPFTTHEEQVPRVEHEHHSSVTPSLPPEDCASKDFEDNLARPAGQFTKKSAVQPWNNAQSQAAREKERGGPQLVSRDLYTNVLESNNALADGSVPEEKGKAVFAPADCSPAGARAYVADAATLQFERRPSTGVSKDWNLMTDTDQEREAAKVPSKPRSSKSKHSPGLNAAAARLNEMVQTLAARKALGRTSNVPTGTSGTSKGSDGAENGLDAGQPAVVTGVRSLRVGLSLSSANATNSPTKRTQLSRYVDVKEFDTTQTRLRDSSLEKDVAEETPVKKRSRTSFAPEGKKVRIADKARRHSSAQEEIRGSSGKSTAAFEMRTDEEVIVANFAVKQSGDSLPSTTRAIQAHVNNQEPQSLEGNEKGAEFPEDSNDAPVYSDRTQFAPFIAPESSSKNVAVTEGALAAPKRSTRMKKPANGGATTVDLTTRLGTAVVGKVGNQRTLSAGGKSPVPEISSARVTRRAANVGGDKNTPPRRKAAASSTLSPLSAAKKKTSGKNALRAKVLISKKRQKIKGRRAAGKDPSAKEGKGIASEQVPVADATEMFPGSSNGTREGGIKAGNLQHPANPVVGSDARGDQSTAWIDDIEKTSCLVCDGLGEHEKMVLCEACSSGCHTFCMRPSRSSVPLGVWICPQCHRTAERHQVHLSRMVQLRGERQCLECNTRDVSATEECDKACAECKIPFHSKCLRRYQKLGSSHVNGFGWKCQVCTKLDTPKRAARNVRSAVNMGEDCHICSRRPASEKENSACDKTCPECKLTFHSRCLRRIKKFTIAQLKVPDWRCRDCLRKQAQKGIVRKGHAAQTAPTTNERITNLTAAGTLPRLTNETRVVNQVARSAISPPAPCGPRAPGKGGGRGSKASKDADPTHMVSFQVTVSSSPTRSPIGGKISQAHSAEKASNVETVDEFEIIDGSNMPDPSVVPSVEHESQQNDHFGLDGLAKVRSTVEASGSNDPDEGYNGNQGSLLPQDSDGGVAGGLCPSDDEAPIAPGKRTGSQSDDPVPGTVKESETIRSGLRGNTCAQEDPGDASASDMEIDVVIDSGVPALDSFDGQDVSMGIEQSVQRRQADQKAANSAAFASGSESAIRSGEGTRARVGLEGQNATSHRLDSDIYQGDVCAVAATPPSAYAEGFDMFELGSNPGVQASVDDIRKGESRKETVAGTKLTFEHCSNIGEQDGITQSGSPAGGDRSGATARDLGQQSGARDKPRDRREMEGNRVRKVQSTDLSSLDAMTALKDAGVGKENELTRRIEADGGDRDGQLNSDVKVSVGRPMSRLTNINMGMEVVGNRSGPERAVCNEGSNAHRNTENAIPMSRNIIENGRTEKLVPVERHSERAVPLHANSSGVGASAAQAQESEEEQPMFVKEGFVRTWVLLKVGKSFHPTMFADMQMQPYFGDAVRILCLPPTGGVLAVAFSKTECDCSDEIRLRRWWSSNRAHFVRAPEHFPGEGELSDVRSEVLRG